MKKLMKKVGEGEFENNRLKRLINLQEQETLANGEITQYMKLCAVNDKEMEDDPEGI
jgi:hypothetical protein